MFLNLPFLTAFLSCLACVLASPVKARAPVPAVTYLGSQGRILCMSQYRTVRRAARTDLCYSTAGGAAAKGLVYTAGTVPSLNGTIVSGGIRNETVSLWALVSSSRH